MVLLEYFGEDTSTLTPSSICCDVCESPQLVSDQSEEIKAVLQVVDQLPTSGEKRVSLFLV